jgi:poly-gamma-glutamate synthesis protein (capsule biosynthesis protein)
MYFPRLEAGTGRLLGLRMQPTRLRQLQLRRPPQADVAWLWKVLNREGRRFGTGAQLGQDGMLELRWEA